MKIALGCYILVPDSVAGKNDKGECRMDTMTAAWTQERVMDRLESLAEPGYADFCRKLVPGEFAILGVRKPALHKLAKEISRGQWVDWLRRTPCCCHEEKLLKAFVLGMVRPEWSEYEAMIREFIPEIDNWEVCDGFCCGLKIAGERPDLVWPLVKEYAESSKEYEIRFGIVMMLTYYIKKERLTDLFCAFDSADRESYYVRMAVAWAVSMCCVRFPKETEDYLEVCSLDEWTWRKSIQKILESHRIEGPVREKLKKWKKNGRKVGDRQAK